MRTSVKLWLARVEGSQPGVYGDLRQRILRLAVIGPDGEPRVKARRGNELVKRGVHTANVDVQPSGSLEEGAVIHGEQIEVAVGGAEHCGQPANNGAGLARGPGNAGAAAAAAADTRRIVALSCCGAPCVQGTLGFVAGLGAELEARSGLHGKKLAVSPHSPAYSVSATAVSSTM